MLLAAIGASAWNIVGGYAGQVSVGHAVFFGFGAYSAVVVYTHLGWPPIAGAPIGMVLSVALAAVIGVPTLGSPATISAWPPSPSPSWCAC